MKSSNILNTDKRLLVHLITILVITPALLFGISSPNPVSAAGDAVVSISPSTQVVYPGETFTTDIYVVPNNDIAGLQFNLTFDPSLVTVNEIQEGDLLNQNGASTYFYSGNIDNVTGEITGAFGIIITPGETVSNPGTFVTITLTAGSQGGTCPLTLSNVITGDISGNAISTSTIDGSVSINNPPVLDSIGDKMVDEGALLEFTVSANDPNGDTLTYSASNLPSGAAFYPQTRTFSWTPSYSQAGSHLDIHFEVSDGESTDSEDIIITVNNVFNVDLNSDGSVNVLDATQVGQHWDETGAPGWIPEDINEDGNINVLDIIAIGQNWTG